MVQADKSSNVVRMLSHPVRTLGELLQSPAQRVLRVLQVTQAYWFATPATVSAASNDAVAVSFVGTSRSSVMLRNAAAALRDTPRLVSSRVWSRRRLESSLQLR